MSHALPDFDRSLPMLLLRAREATMQRFRPILKSAGMTEQQWRVLRTLAEVDQAGVGELAERCALRPPSMTRIVRNLVDRGLVTRRTDSDDQRRSRLSITPAGIELIAELSPRINAAYEGIRQDLGAEDYTEVLRKLGDIIGDLVSAESEVA